jgi:hypothetical protein
LGDAHQQWNGGRSLDLTPGHTQTNQLERAFKSLCRTFHTVALFLQAPCEC